MKTCLFLGDSITDAEHLFEPENLGYGYVSMIAGHPQMRNWLVTNRGHDGFTIEQIHRMLCRDGIESDWNIITILAGVNDIPVELYTDCSRIPLEFEAYYRKILNFLKQHTNAQLVLMEPFLFDKPASYIPWHKYIQIESEIIQELARDFHALFIPTDDILRNACTVQGTDQITLDGVHLTPEGNQILSNLWLSALSFVS